MKKIRSRLVISIVLLLGCTILTFPFHVMAQGIDVSPTTWDFGAIPVGSSDTVVVTVTSTEPIPLSVQLVEIIDDTTGSFALVSTAPPPTAILYEGDSLDLEIEFTPSALGGHSSQLFIVSDAEAPNSLYYVPLQGRGISGSATEDILDFFDDSVTGGTLAGTGPGESANGRLNALRNMLALTVELISIGDIEGACEQLYAALGKCDGFAPPPDFVTGDAASELASMIDEVLTELECP